MKKITGLTALLLAMFVITSCGTKKWNFLTENKSTNKDSDSTVLSDIAEPPELKMNVGDEIIVKIELNYTPDNTPGQIDPIYTVDASGNLYIDQFGSFNVIGKTANEAQQIILEKVSKQLEDPKVFVKIKTYHIQVIGSVSGPGILNVDGGNPITVIQAIGLAGNTTSNARTNEVKLLRKVGGQVISYNLDLTSTDLFTNKGIYVQSGDIIYVPGRPSFSVTSIASIINAIAIVLNTIILLSRI